MLKKFTSNSNLSPSYQPHSNILQTLQSKKRTSIIAQQNNFYSEFLQKLKNEEEEQNKINSMINVISEPTSKKQTTQQPSQQQIYQFKNMNTLTNTTNNLNVNNYITLNDNNQPLKSAGRTKNNTGSPNQFQKEKPITNEQPTKTENNINNNVITNNNNIVKQHNYKTRHRASVSYFITPQSNQKLFALNNNSIVNNNNNNNNTNILTLCNNANNEKTTKLRKQKTVVSKGFEVESNINEVQFLGPNIPLRQFVSKWEPISNFEILNVETFSNYGTVKTIAQAIDPNTKNIINNIIITSNANNANANEDKAKVDDISNNQTERKQSDLYEGNQKSINNHKGNLIPKKLSIKKYANIVADEETQSQSKEKSPKKKRKGFLCCL